VPVAASPRNPIDLTPETFLKPDWLENFPHVLDLIAADEAIDGTLIQFGAQAVKGMEVAEVLAAFVKRSPKPIVVSWPLAPPPVPAYLREQRIHAHDEYARGIRVAAHLVRYAERVRERSHQANVQALDFDWTAQVPDATAGLVVSEDECHRLLAAAGLPTARGMRTHTREEAVAAAQQINHPVVLKAISRDITHRHANGVVLLNLETDQAVGDAFDLISERAGALGAKLDGVYVEAMEPPGDEILVSALRDSTFGVIVSCGAGGVLTEVIGDVILERGPFDVDVAARMLQKLRVVERILLREPERDLTPLAQFVSRFSQFAASVPWSRFVLEVNPVNWTPQQVAALDGLLIIEEL
jgi:acetyltransferase